MIAVRETTTPALADSGMRSFAIQLHEFHAVEILVSHNRDNGRYDEPVTLTLSNEVINNTDLTTALIQLAAKAVSTIGSSLG